MSTLFEAPVVKPAFDPQAIHFVVFGKAVPQGSTRAFIPKGWSRAIITTDNTKLKPWRQQISATATELGAVPFAKDAALAITLEFYFEKPPSVSKKRIHPTVLPDLDKICRSLFDGLTGILFKDDAQIVDLRARKHYGTPERCEIELREIR